MEKPEIETTRVSNLDMRVESQDKLEQVDTAHQDEAMKVLNAYDGDETWSEQEEKELRRKIDLRLMPVLCVTYGLQYYDKAMLGQAVNIHPLSVQKLRSLEKNRLSLGYEPIWP